MKRSEALKLIAGEILDFANEVNCEKQAHVGQCAERILSKLEKAKMKPPWNDAEFQRQARIYIGAEGYAWEPEQPPIILRPPPEK